MCAFRTPFRLLTALAAALLLQPVLANLGPLPDPGRIVDLDRYAGDWHVHASVPVRIPFFSDANARDYTERYELADDGTIRMICEFVDAKTGKQRRFEFKAAVTDDPSRASWRVQFVWPVRATYQIIYLDDSYETTIVADANRKFAWIMSRDAELSDSRYETLLDVLVDAGYEREALRRIPHSS